MVRGAEIRDIHEARREAAGRRGVVKSTNGRQHDAGCPRCAARMLFDGEQFSCLMCGYEHAGPRLRGARSAGDLLDALPALRTELIGHADSLGAEPESGSPAQREQRGASPTETAALEFARLFAHQSLISSGHSLIALARGLEPPTPEYGTWSVARSVLDTTSLACWLLDPDIGRRDRTRRAAGIQLADLEAEADFLTTLLAQRPADEEGFSDSLSANRARRQGAAAAAVELGGGITPPDSAERAAMLGAEFEHVMCGAIIEGRPWALLHTTAVTSSHELDRVRSILTTQVQLSASWYARAVWAYVTWMSRESVPELQSALEFGYDSLALADGDETRFWRRPRALRPRDLAAS